MSLETAFVPAPVPDILERTVRRHSHRTAIDFLGARMTYGQLGEQVERAARGLQALGVDKGTRVGLCLPNTPFSVIFFYAVLKAGGVVVNYNPLYVERELRHQIEDSGTTLMVTLDSAQVYPKVAAMLGTSCLERIVVCALADALPGAAGDAVDIPDDGRHVRFRHLMANDGRPLPVAIDPTRDLAVLQYTGGTTGVAKGAMLTHANIAASTFQARGVVAGVEEGRESIVVVLPLFHIFALTIGLNLGVALAAELILLPRFEIGQVMACIAQKRPTMLPGVPTIYGAINAAAEQGQWDLSSLRICISGGAPLPLEIRSRFERLTGCRLLEGYGLSEGTPVTCNPVAGVVKDGSVGLPTLMTRIEIRSPSDPGTLLAPGETGEVCLRGPQIMSGYWNRDSADCFTDGALRTGDVGYLDQDGYLFLVDRIKDLIICGGYNVYPRVIEEALYRHPCVAEAIVIGIPDDYRGQAPKAFVRLRDDRTTTVEELRDFLSGQISVIEMPKTIELRSELPKTTVGKLSKKELIAEELARMSGRDSSGA